MKLIPAIGAAALLASCASQPQANLGTLKVADPKYDSTACLQARNIALTYNDHTGQRIAGGLALGLLLGPFGIPIAAGLDAKANEERKAVNAEVARRCVS